MGSRALQSNWCSWDVEDVKNNHTALGLEAWKYTTSYCRSFNISLSSSGSSVSQIWQWVMFHFKDCKLVAQNDGDVMVMLILDESSPSARGRKTGFNSRDILEMKSFVDGVLIWLFWVQRFLVSLPLAAFKRPHCSWCGCGIIQGKTYRNVSNV